MGDKLHWSTGNVWSGSIAIEAGAQVTYTYYRHPISTGGFCSGNSTAISQPVNLTVPSAAGPPYSGKFIRYFSSWSSSNFQFRDITQNGSWTQVAMQRVGQGRTSSESVFEMAGVAQSADEIEFIFNDGNGHYDNAPAPPSNTPQGAAPGTPVPYQSLSPPSARCHGLAANVLPTLDYNYRTLNQPGQPIQAAANITAGSSLGGLLTAYMGMTNSNVFGKIGVFSPAFWAGPNFINNTLDPAPKLPLTIYMDIGSSESSSSQSDSNVYWLDAFGVYNTWLGDGYAVNSELLMYPKCGAVHNEAAWSGRLPVFFQFALSLWSEPNTIALEKFPPRLELLNCDPVNGTARLHFLAPLGIPFVLNRSIDLMTWPDQSPLAPATAIWEDRFLDEQFPAPAERRFWRLSY
jgi:Putative esterase